MFLLLILNYCCSDGIIGEASDVFGYRVWVLVYRVWCFHPVELVICILPDGSILPDCFISILWKSSLLVVVHPVGSLQVLVCCRDPVVEARRPLIVIAIGSVVISVIGGSLQLSRQCVVVGKLLVKK